MKQTFYYKVILFVSLILNEGTKFLLFYLFEVFLNQNFQMGVITSNATTTNSHRIFL